MNKLPTQARAQIIHLLCEGNSIRAVTRLTGASKNTVTKLLIDAGKACADYQDKALRDLPCKGRVASITGQARSTLTRENGQPTDSNLAQPSSVILLRARTPICASVF